MQLYRVLLTVVLGHVIVIYGLITQQTIRDITNVTEECRGRISGDYLDDESRARMSEGVGIRGGIGQSILSAIFHGDQDGNEVEDTVSAALKILCSSLLVELEKPLYAESSPSAEDLRCRVIIREYHALLGATVKFLHEVQERQMLWNWNAESLVFDGVCWLQGLWASRSTNTQERSFIEQQMAFYGSTECFRSSNEVLRRDVEVVEYMNDLIDSFNGQAS